MRKISIAVLLLVSCFASAAAAQTYVGVLNGANEFPGPGDPDGFGLFGLRIEGTTVAYSIMIQHISSANASHIHRGAAGVAGPVVITLASSYPNNFASGVGTASAALIDEIRSNPAGFYVNVHGPEFPNGAIRGQLTSGAFAVATGANEFPGPGDADGLGMAVFSGSGSDTTVNYAALEQSIAAPTASHLHRGAAGVAGPVVVTLASSYPGDRATGTVTVSQALQDEIFGNPSNFYFNIHNADFSNGAIRGPLALAAYNSTQYFPVVGKVDGLNNTKFVADLRIVNPSDSPTAVQLEFFPSGAAGGSAPAAVRGMAVGPHAEAVINDVVGTQFSATGLGALKVGSDGGLTTGVRVFNDQRAINQGTTGFFIPPRGLFGAATSGTLPFLSQASDADIQAGLGFRSNIGWFNPNMATAGMTFTARRASDGAVLGTVSVSVAGLSQVQQAVFSLISTVAAGDRAQSDFYVTWTSTIPAYVYAAIVDNKTGDVVYVD
ncbi:MAG TPA: CHRD domain-containing protein [Thermoanaerobaculia bacterium]